MVATEEADWARRVSDRCSADARAYLDLWAPVLLAHGQKLLDVAPLRGVSRARCGCGLRSAPAVDPEPCGISPHGWDNAMGMLALAPSNIPRAAMDAGYLGIASAAVDVVVLAFVLFHTANPQAVLIEARRVMRTGGSIGTTTWEGDPDFPAQRVWIEELDAHGAAPAARQLVSNHEPVSSGARVRRLLERAGFASVRTWTHRFGHAYTLEEFMAVRTEIGWSRRRFESLTPEVREMFLRNARLRLEKMSRRDLVDDAKIIFATGMAVNCQT